MTINSTPFKMTPLYQPLPSAFTIIEKPMRFFHDKTEKWISTIFNSIKKFEKIPVIYEIAKLWGMVEFMILAVPTGAAITGLIILTPLTVLTDMITGIAEIAFASYKGCDRATLKSIAHLKFIAYPVQQLAFLGTVLTLPLLITAISLPEAYIDSSRKGSGISCTLLGYAIGTLVLTAPLLYGFGQKNINKLPKWARPEKLNIFIDGGASDQYGRKYTEDYFDRNYAKYKTESRNDFVATDLNDVYQAFRNEIKLLDKKENSKFFDYNEFKLNLMDGKSAKDLFKLKNEFTKKDLKKSYYAYALLFHPDKNIGNEEEAAVLMKCINEIRFQLENQAK